jgi:hypothetical protein
LLEIQDTEAQPINLNLQVDEEFLASRNSFVIQTSITSFIEVDVKVEDDGKEKEWIDEALRNIEPMDTMSPLKP